MMGTITSTPADLLTSSKEHERRYKTASMEQGASAALNDRLYCISAKYTLQAGEEVSINISLAAKSFIFGLSSSGCDITEFRNSYSTGAEDGIFEARSLNLTSIDETPAQAQIFYSHTKSGDVVASGFLGEGFYFVADYDSEPCLVIKNSGNESSIATVNFFIEEIGVRSPFLGLTASTQLTPTTEMSEYNGPN